MAEPVRIRRGIAAAVVGLVALLPSTAVASATASSASPTATTTPAAPNAAADPVYQAQIAGGSVAANGAWPFAAQVILNHGSGGLSFCGGTLIAPQWVITAAHCVLPSDEPAAQLAGSEVRLGSNEYGKGTSYAVASMTAHPDYTPTFDSAGNPLDIDAGNDVALIGLAAPATQTPLPLISASELSLAARGAPVTMLGWGVNDLNGAGSQSPVLRQGEMSVVQPEDFGYVAYPLEIWTQSTTASACFGDSGGPLVARAGDGSYRLVGVVSGGPNCNIHVAPREQDYFARVSQKTNWINSVVNPAAAVVPPVPTGPPARFEPLTPDRLLDTRTGVGGATRLAAGATVRLQVTGMSGVPAGAATATLNVVASAPGGPGFVTVYPCDRPVPTASNLNYTNETVANLVTAPLAADGSVCLFSYDSTDLIVDVFGYTGAGATKGFSAAGPLRIADTRTSTPVKGPIAAGATLQLTVAGFNGVPANASAVVLNVTAADTASSGHVTAYPCGTAVPNASSINYPAKANVPNLVVVPVGTGGAVCFTSYADTQLVVDLDGWYAPAAPRQLTPLSPSRLLDTRIGLSGTRLHGQGTLTLDVRGLAALAPTTNSVVLNVTAVDPSGAGYLTVYRCDAALPRTSNVNHAAGQNSPNAVYVPLAANGTVCIYSWATTDVVVDISGSFA
ncbi:MAG: trypsin-like serine protease [Acidimicrobiia bacterium]